MRLLILVSAAAILLTACDKPGHDLRFVTPTEFVDRSIVEELGEVFDENSPINAIVLPEPRAEKEALDMVASGEADIALVSNYLPFRDDVATVMPLYPTVLHIGVNGESIDTLDIADGITVIAGHEGSASRLIFEQIVDNVKLEPGEYRYVSPDYDNPDIVVAFAPISRESVEALSTLKAAQPDFQLTSIGTPEDIGTGKQIDAAVLVDPHLRPFIIPQGTYGDLTDKPIVTVAVDKMLVTRPDLDRAIVYDLINEILRLRPALAANRPGQFRVLADDFDASSSTYVLHPGTQAYLLRDEPSVYERYSGIAEVLVTVLIAIASATVAAVRIVKRLRKNRIDEFYAKVLELGRQAKATEDPGEFERIRDEIRSLQTEAFDLLIDEKLAADESFRIFVTLSDDVLSDMSGRA